MTNTDLERYQIALFLSLVSRYKHVVGFHIMYHVPCQINFFEAVLLSSPTRYGKFIIRLGYLQDPCNYGFSLKKSGFSHNYFLFV